MSKGDRVKGLLPHMHEEHGVPQERLAIMTVTEILADHERRMAMGERHLEAHEAPER